MLYDEAADQTESDLGSSVEELSERKKRDNEKNSFQIVHWFKDSLRINKLTASSRYRLLNNDNDLRIRNVNINDAGLFKCKQINGFGGSVMHSLNLIVEPFNANISTPARGIISKQLNKQQQQQQQQQQEVNEYSAPVFVNVEKMQPRYLRKQKGAEIKLKCKANAVPKPEIIWLKNGQVLTEEEYGITRFVIAYILHFNHFFFQYSKIDMCLSFNYCLFIYRYIYIYIDLNLLKQIIIIMIKLIFFFVFD